ncbi:relaxase family protein [Gluconacetobacter tumulicola]|uniref:Uncharacterized protein n=1 Tax=Gluconacetobacter tumulicola TaxID=1017177 RepID=A0A7W4JF40_9PROT|nr:hypothetical protein [Gluconacetobacter tumulicola]MBB2180127.1 hypothetical protein [Gluconacetobacter tumulicola]
MLQVILSSKEPIADEQFRLAMAAHAREFGYNPDALALAVEHGKERHDGEAHNYHRHYLIRLIDPDTGRRINLDNSYARNELVAREFEARHGLRILNGHHNEYVMEHTRDDSVRESMKAFIEAEDSKPQSAFTSKQKAKADRLGIDLAQVRQDVRDMWRDAGGSWARLTESVHARGWRMEQGDKAGVVVLKDSDDHFLGSVGRLLGLRKNQLTDAMSGVIIAPPEPKASSRNRKNDDGVSEKPDSAAPKESPSKETPSGQPAGRPGCGVAPVRADLGRVRVSDTGFVRGLSKEIVQANEVKEKLERQAADAVNASIQLMQKMMDESSAANPHARILWMTSKSGVKNRRNAMNTHSYDEYEGVRTYQRDAIPDAPRAGFSFVQAVNNNDCIYELPTKHLPADADGGEYHIRFDPLCNGRAWKDNYDGSYAEDFGLLAAKARTELAGLNPPTSEQQAIMAHKGDRAAMVARVAQGGEDRLLEMLEQETEIKEKIEKLKGSWWGLRKATMSEQEQKQAEVGQNIAAFAVWFVKHVFAKFGLCAKPQPWERLGPLERQKLAEEYQRNQLAQLVVRQARAQQDCTRPVAEAVVRRAEAAHEAYESSPQVKKLRENIMLYDSLAKPDAIVDIMRDLPDSKYHGKLADNLNAAIHAVLGADDDSPYRDTGFLRQIIRDINDDRERRGKVVADAEAATAAEYRHGQSGPSINDVMDAHYEMPGDVPDYLDGDDGNPGGRPKKPKSSTYTPKF